MTMSLDESDYELFRDMNRQLGRIGDLMEAYLRYTAAAALAGMDMIGQEGGVDPVGARESARRMRENAEQLLKDVERA